MISDFKNPETYSYELRIVFFSSSIFIGFGILSCTFQLHGMQNKYSANKRQETLRQYFDEISFFLSFFLRLILIHFRLLIFFSANVNDLPFEFDFDIYSTIFARLCFSDFFSRYYFLLFFVFMCLCVFVYVFFLSLAYNITICTWKTEVYII